MWCPLTAFRLKAIGPTARVVVQSGGDTVEVQSCGVTVVLQRGGGTDTLEVQSGRHPEWWYSMLLAGVSTLNIGFTEAPVGWSVFREDQQRVI